MYVYASEYSDIHKPVYRRRKFQTILKINLCYNALTYIVLKPLKFLLFKISVTTLINKSKFNMEHLLHALPLIFYVICIQTYICL